MILQSRFMFAQAPQIQWQKSIGGSLDDYANSVFITKDGGILIVGSTNSDDYDISNRNTPSGYNDIWLLKLSGNGSILWDNCYGGTAYDNGNSVIQSIDSGFVIAGNTSSWDGDVISGVHNHSRDYWVVKTNSNRILQWEKCLGGGQYDIAYSIIQTADTGYLVVGKTSSFDGDVIGFNGGEDLWAVKLNQNGSIMWSNSLGGSSYEQGLSCKQTADGNYLIAGTASSNDGDVTGNNYPSSDVWIIKLDSSGQIIWNKCYGGSALDGSAEILLADNGSFFVASHTSSNDIDVAINYGNNDFWLFKADSSGNILWQKSYGGSSIEECRAAALTADGGVVLTGESYVDDGMVSGNHNAGFLYFDYWVIKVDSIGNLEWGKCLGGSNDEEVYSIKQTPDSGFIVVGYSDSNDGDVMGNRGGTDAWVVKLGPPPLFTNEIENHLTDFSISQKEEQLQLRFFYKHKATANFNIFDLTGKKLFEKQIQINEGINHQFISCTGFASGVYVLNVEAEGISQWAKAMVFSGN